MNRRPLLWPAVAVLLLAAGCGKSDKITNPVDSAGAEQKALLGDAAAGNGDYAAANQLFKDALALDPANSHANLGAAVTELSLLESDTEVNDLADRIYPFLGPRPNLLAFRLGSRTAAPSRLAGLVGRRDYGTTATGRALGNLFMAATSDPPLLSEAQGVLRRRVLPKLQYAEDRLNVIEQNAQFALFLPPATTGGPDTLEVDLGEVRFLDAVINELQGWLGLVVAYNFDLPFPTELVPPDSLLAPGTNFGKLNSGGAAILAQVRLDFLQAHTEFVAGVDGIGAETDPQDDDLVPQAALNEAGFAQFQTDFDSIVEALSGPIDVDMNDHLGNPMTISVSIGNFFTNAIADLKTKLPAHAFDPTTGEPYATDPVTFPDPVFNGIFPGMTNVLWRQLIGPVAPANGLASATRR